MQCDSLSHACTQGMGLGIYPLLIPILTPLCTKLMSKKDENITANRYLKRFWNKLLHNIMMYWLWHCGSIPLIMVFFTMAFFNLIQQFLAF